MAVVDGKTVQRTLKDKSIEDFEDGLEYYSAQSAKCKCIVSEDRKHLFFSKLEVSGARKFLEKHVMQ